MNILDWIVDYLLIPILDLADFIRLYGDRQTRRLLRTELYLSIAMLALFTLGLIIGWEVLVIFSAFFTSILGLFIWKQTEIALNVLSALSGIKLETDSKILKPITKPVELAQKIFDPAIEGMKKILMPLLTTSLAISFLASYIAIKGLDYFNFKDLMIYSTIILFLAIYFWAYLEVKTKIAGKAMFVWLLWLIAAHYLWPIQFQALVETAENKTIGWVLEKSGQTRNKKMLDIATDTPLYEFNHGDIKLLRKTDKNMKVKILGRKKSPNTEETLYRVILPVQEGVYIGGEEVYVPAFMTSPTGKKYFLEEDDGGFMKIKFLSDDPVVVLKNWQAGQKIKISGYGDDIVYFRDGGRRAKVPTSGVMTSLVNQPLEITYKKGGTIYINY